MGGAIYAQKLLPHKMTMKILENTPRVNQASQSSLEKTYTRIPTQKIGLSMLMHTSTVTMNGPRGLHAQSHVVEVFTEETLSSNTKQKKAESHALPTKPRYLLNPHPKNPVIITCFPLVFFVQKCNTQDCAPVACEMSDYSDWGECSKTCGEGYQVMMITTAHYSSRGRMNN
jgi:hypothetical protein